MSANTYNVFVRTWWRAPTAADGVWPDNRVPHLGKKTYLRRGLPNIDEARAVCAEYNRTHAPGKMSKKAEFESN
jgi:hypothetical protein